MKKRIFSLALVLILGLTLFSAAVLADEENTELGLPPRLRNMSIRTGGGSAWIEVWIQTPTEVLNVMSILSAYGKSDRYGGYILEVAVGSGEWQSTQITSIETEDISPWNSYYRTNAIPGLTESSRVRARARYFGKNDDGATIYSEWSEIAAVNGDAADPTPAEPEIYEVSDWVVDQGILEAAESLDLIPEVFPKDLTQPITRLEFAALSVKLYEALSGEKAEPAPEDTFSDTQDADVLKAFNLGVTNGTSIEAKTFTPDKLIARQEASTMLTRVYKKLNLPDWTLETDKDYAEEFRTLFETPELFVDDAEIADWAKDSVYFMAANGIVNGVSTTELRFAPAIVMVDGKATNYATREQALTMAVRMVQNLGVKPE